MFGTALEQLDLALLSYMGYEVVDINTPEVQIAYKTHGMAIFQTMIMECDALFFRAFADGQIGAGVYKEIGYAIDIGIPVLEFPVNAHYRALSVAETRERLK
jgi:hypothetical protein